MVKRYDFRLYDVRRIETFEKWIKEKGINQTIRDFLDGKPETKAIPLKVEEYPSIQQCENFSEYPAKPEYIKCRQIDNRGKVFWRIAKREECEACSQYKTLDINEEMAKHNKVKIMIETEQHHLAELQSQRTRLKEEIRLLKDKKPEQPKPQIVEKIVEKVIEKPLDKNIEEYIKELEEQVKYWKDEAKENARAYNDVLMEGYVAEKPDHYFEINALFESWQHGRAMPKRLRELLQKHGCYVEMKR